MPRQLEMIYPNWSMTDFWFYENAITIPTHPRIFGVNPVGIGWDNPRKAASGERSAGVAAYLILQMKTLAACHQLGRKDEAANWTERATAHLKLFRETFLADGRLVTA